MQVQLWRRHRRRPPPSPDPCCPTRPPQSGADFEVVNVLDDVYNPGLREAIKTYSAWPTIPQVGWWAAELGGGG